MKNRYPIRCLDAFTEAAIAEHRRQHEERLAADEGYRAITEEWRARWERRKDEGETP